jgi:hypothetical protein
MKDQFIIVGSKKGMQYTALKRINNFDKLILADVAYLVGISHDFGKITKFFQEYL